jgi:phospholipase C
MPAGWINPPAETTQEKTHEVRPREENQSVSQSVSRIFLAISMLSATAMPQSIPQGTFKHIIIVVQENRTPDNLFGAASPFAEPCGTSQDFMAGVDIVVGGPGYYYDSAGNPHYAPEICDGPLLLNGWDANIPGYSNGSQSVDPLHTNEAWVSDFVLNGSGQADGFCHEFNTYSIYAGQCPSYSYVQQSDVQPYFDIAQNYGFANYMFQSNEGPSQPAHQFLFTGTSAPVAPTDMRKDLNGFYDYLDFVADLPSNTNNVPVTCNATNPNDLPPWVEPNGTPIPSQLVTECYTHDSLMTDAAACGNGGPDFCDRGITGISPSYNVWGYYAEPSSGQIPQSIWDAPANIPEACYGLTTQYIVEGVGQSCGNGGHSSSEWSDHLRIPGGYAPWNGNYQYSNAPIFDDLYNCELPAVSWVIPDQAYSDHPYSATQSPIGSESSIAIGPSWVGDIIDAVGGGMTGSGCNPTTNPYYWTQEPTAIFVVWDDWGGWYDHVLPWTARRDGGSSPYTACDPSTQWGCGYTDGFRVPFLVVSAYTPVGYISGKCGVTGYPACGSSGNQPPKYVHDFGSILAFIEWNFGMQPINANSPGYADSNAPDNQGNTPLSDFFSPSQRSFTTISTPYQYPCFTQQLGNCPLANGNWQAAPPDTD